MKHFVILSIGLLLSGSAFAFSSSSNLYDWKYSATSNQKIGVVTNILYSDGRAGLYQPRDISKCIDKAAGPFTFSLTVYQATEKCKQKVGLNELPEDPTPPYTPNDNG